MTMVSLKDIAAACGVSASTVSKALNDLDDISEKRKAIFAEYGSPGIENKNDSQYRRPVY